MILFVCGLFAWCHPNLALGFCSGSASGLLFLQRNIRRLLCEMVGKRANGGVSYYRTRISGDWRSHTNKPQPYTFQPNKHQPYKLHTNKPHTNKHHTNKPHTNSVLPYKPQPYKRHTNIRRTSVALMRASTRSCAWELIFRFRLFHLFAIAVHPSCAKRHLSGCRSHVCMSICMIVLATNRHCVQIFVRKFC
jgi:hypothetical protein